MEPRIKISPVCKNVYRIQELDYKEHCNCYLIVGDQKCLLIDVGIGLIDFFSSFNYLIKNKELVVVITHFHFDHFGGMFQFDKVFANEISLKNKDTGLKYFDKKDFTSLEFYHKVKNNLLINENKILINESKIKNIADEEIIDLGDIKLQVIYTSGHDSSSISLFDFNNKILFSGDLIYNGELYYHFDDSNIDDYLESLNRIITLKPLVICGGHNDPVSENVARFIRRKIKEIEKD